MRTALLLLMLALTTACGDRRTFDERYGDTERELNNRANSLDRQLDASSNEAQGNKGE